MPVKKTIESSAPPPKGVDGPTLVGSATINWGATPEETVALYGGAAVDSNALASAIVTIQGGIRRMLRAKKTPEEIQAAYDVWKLGVAVTRVSDPTAAIMAKWPSMSEAERADFLKKLKGAERK